MHFTMSENALARKGGRARQLFHSTESEVYSPMRAGEWNFTPLQVVTSYNFQTKFIPFSQYAAFIWVFPVCPSTHLRATSIGLNKSICVF